MMYAEENKTNESKSMNSSAVFTRRTRIVLGGICTFLAMLLIVSAWAIPFLMAGEKSVSFKHVQFEKGKLTVNVEKSPLGKVLDEIHRECMVKIIGLEKRENEIITFSSKREKPEDVLKRLLRQLNIDNYAFEFNNDKLVKVSVFPKSKMDVSSHPFQETPKKPNEKFVSAVRVKAILKGTQAEELELKKGDLIISYDGVKIRSDRQLIREVKNKSDKDDIELVVLRDGQTIPFWVKGGRIGVNIKTEKILNPNNSVLQIIN
ncbi:MAG: PDZ domain-containing protein [Deltaproteobacteria bacterium]|nr:PDZ domain-containing protein [Deltaproteobacteria bacterium]